MMWNRKLLLIDRPQKCFKKFQYEFSRQKWPDFNCDSSFLEFTFEFFEISYSFSQWLKIKEKSRVVKYN